MVGEEHKRTKFEKFWRKKNWVLEKQVLTTEEGRVEKEFKDDCLLFLHNVV